MKSALVPFLAIATAGFAGAFWYERSRRLLAVEALQTNFLAAHPESQATADQMARPPAPHLPDFSR